MKKVKVDRLEYVLHGRPITKKNSMQMVKNPKTGKMFPIPSKQYKEYEKAVKEDIDILPVKPIDFPVKVEVKYFLSTNKDGSLPKNPPDLTNLLEATCDLLVHYKVLADDNCQVIASHDGSRVIYSDIDPVAFITIIAMDHREIEAEAKYAEEGE